MGKSMSALSGWLRTLIAEFTQTLWKLPCNSLLKYVSENVMQRFLPIQYHCAIFAA